MSSVTLKIPVDSLMQLPSKAEYRAKDGQANVSARHENGLIVVNATCDSLQAVCEYYKRQYNFYRAMYEMQEDAFNTEVVKEPPNPLKIFGFGTLCGAILAAIVMYNLKTTKE